MKLKDEKKQALMARKNRNLIFSALIWMGGAFFAGGFFCHSEIRSYLALKQRLRWAGPRWRWDSPI